MEDLYRAFGGARENFIFNVALLNSGRRDYIEAAFRIRLLRKFVGYGRRFRRSRRI